VSEEGISKSAFAELTGVTPGRVSQWLSANQIHGDALVGSGRTARIRPTVAIEQLRLRLDVGHRVRANTRAELNPVIAPPAPAVTDAPAPRVGSDVERQIQLERLETARRTNRKMAEEEAARSGRYTRAAETSRSMGKIAAMLIGLFESWLGELSSKLAATFGLPQRDVIHVLRSEFRLFRASASTALRRESEQLAVFVEDDPNEGAAAADDGTAPMEDATAHVAEQEGQSVDGDD
jgi:hypothetical protein